MKLLTVSVNYADYLAVTLPRNLRRGGFERAVVVTSTSDYETMWVASAQGTGVDFVATDVFRCGGASFAKGAMIEAGLDLLGRDGWICLMDADTVLPPEEGLWDGARRGYLYSPYRRCADGEGKYSREACEFFADRPSTWRRLSYGWEHPESPRQQEAVNHEFAGYCQVFHGGDRVLKKRPWYDPEMPTCQGSDTAFYQRWPESRRARPTWEVLHFGPLGKHWAGRRESSRRRAGDG